MGGAHARWRGGLLRRAALRATEAARWGMRDQRVCGAFSRSPFSLRRAAQEPGFALPHVSSGEHHGASFAAWGGAGAGGAAGGEQQGQHQHAAGRGPLDPAYFKPPDWVKASLRNAQGAGGGGMPDDAAAGEPGGAGTRRRRHRRR